MASVWCVGCGWLGFVMSWGLVVMLRVRFVGVVVLLVCVCGGVGASVAAAEEAPYWSIQGTRLAAGKTFEITAKAKGNQTLTAAGLTITCTAIALKEGAVLLGSNAGEPGRSDEIIKYNGCTITGNGEPCKVTSPGEGELVTEPLTNELAYASNKKSLVVEFKPIKGKTLAIFKFTGSGCKETETSVRGVVVTQVLTDPGEVLLELPNAVTPATSFLLKLIPAAHTKIWLITAGVGSEIETEEIDFFGHEATLAGTTLILLAEKGKSVEKLWSPLL
jgi:hypothetical protein